MASCLEKYKSLLSLDGVEQILSLGEGNTPLVNCDRIGSRGNLFLKMEQLNPTGSFKDRFAAVETAVMKQAGINTFIATSSGNTGSALAAYSAKYQIRCLLFVNEITPDGKLEQMLAYGAEIFRVKDFGITKDLSAPIFDRLQALAEQSGSRLVISAFRYSPQGMQGVKTIAYEILEQFEGVAPSQIFVPVGGGGLLSGIWQGFLDLKERKIIDRFPRINAVQPELNDTVVTALTENRRVAREVQTTTTISGLAVQVDIDATLALNAVRNSGGSGYLVTDDDIRDAKEKLGCCEGIYVEPAGAASVAGYLKAVSKGHIDENENVVCIATGHGLKDVGAGYSLFKNDIKDISLGDLAPNLIQPV